MPGAVSQFSMGHGITVTRTSISRSAGLFSQAVETHPLTGVTASISEFGGQYSHRTFTRTATGAAVGSLVGMPLLGAVMAPDKQEDNRSYQVTINGPGFCWTYTTRTLFTLRGLVARLNDWAAQYTADPVNMDAAVAAAQAKAEELAEIRTEVKAEQRQAGYTLSDSEAQKHIDRYEAKAAEARAAGKAGRADRAEMTAHRLRESLAKRQARRSR